MDKRTKFTNFIDVDKLKEELKKEIKDEILNELYKLFQQENIIEIIENEDMED